MTNTAQFQSKFGSFSPKAKYTPEGGLAVWLLNKTGGASVKGTVVMADTTTDNACKTADADTVYPIGVIYDSGVADGKMVWVVVSGIAQALLKNSTATTRGYTGFVSDVAGRMDTASGTPATHDREIGHCLESNAGGTDQLVNVVLHFR